MTFPPTSFLYEVHTRHARPGKVRKATDDVWKEDHGLREFRVSGVYACHEDEQQRLGVGRIAQLRESYGKSQEDGLLSDLDRSPPEHGR